MPVNDNNPKDPNAVTATTTPPSTLDAERGDLLTGRYRKGRPEARNARMNRVPRHLTDERAAA
ncbi:hypothetical protein ABZ260_18875 [Streptosporangium sp. NPDC006013]|uniref:hypothetical protein n=1 Tax=Streptosporangium sp. NPDC006013 TaxID=3155596 RepID=UPI0033AE1F7B